MHKRKQVWADKGMEVIGSEGVRSRGDVMPTAGRCDVFIPPFGHCMCIPSSYLLLVELPT